MVDELVDIVDENNNLINIQKMKSEAHQKGLWHRSSHIWIYNSDGQVLLQLRSKNKLIFPNVWDVSVAGHIPANNNAKESSVREISEEIGLEVNEADLEYIKTLKIKTKTDSFENNEFIYIYILKCNYKIEDLKIQKEELQDIKLVSTNFIRSDFKNNPKNYTPGKDYWMGIMDDIDSRISNK